MAPATVRPVHRGDRALDRDQRVRDDRDHPFRLLAVNDSEDRADRRARIAIAAIIGVGVLLRLLVLRSPGFPSDVATFQAWAERLAQIGPANFYEPGYFSDYPPGYLYVLWLFAALFDGELLRLVVKAASIPADIAIALIGASLAWRAAGRTSGVVTAGLWMLAPGPI